MNSFWQGLPRPFFVLAPMADVTDPAYRALIAASGKPHVTWTEFVSADGLYFMREKKGVPDEENPLIRDLSFTEAERPIVAQLFTSNPERMAYAAKLCAALGYDGIDINMGCPDRSIEKQGAGAAMIKTPEVAKAVIQAAKESGLPVSVKTRLGYNEDTLETWLSHILSEKPAALTVHLRTRKEMSKVPAHWDRMAAAVALRDALSPETRILGNGDVLDLNDAKEKARATGADGIMIGRGIFGNPWVFAGRTLEETSPQERLHALVQFAYAFETMRPQKSFHLVRKHVKAFATGFEHAAELRAALMETTSAKEMEDVLRTFPWYTGQDGTSVTV